MDVPLWTGGAAAYSSGSTAVACSACTVAGWHLRNMLVRRWEQLAYFTTENALVRRWDELTAFKTGALRATWAEKKRG